MQLRTNEEKKRSPNDVFFHPLNIWLSYPSKTIIAWFILLAFYSHSIEVHRNCCESLPAVVKLMGNFSFYGIFNQLGSHSNSASDALVTWALSIATFLYCATLNKAIHFDDHIIVFNLWHDSLNRSIRTLNDGWIEFWIECIRNGI